ncbi:protein spinster homolog 3 isoform X8 [Vulpes lagopus]|uniref:protein spinster homolog 3 isoform X8 n=1 Tax=Vulpes lagopus TaxID=494514 RepID=UPI001BC90209|nr:protein spinster homolog 3 isoform X8 [Vulpes lagopus]
MSTECGEPGPGGPSRGSGPGQCPPPTASTPWSLPRWRACVAAAVLCYINLLNYMNWFIVAGVLLDVQNFFHISDSNAGLLQTVFICCLLLSAPVFGYLGDRHSRKATLSFGILLWSGAGLSGSFISPQVMPCLEVTGLILLLTLVPDPPRGAADKQEEAAMGAGRSSWCEDVRYLGTNWSFVWSTLGVTAMAFVTGALSFWVPKFLFEARVVHGLQLPCITDPCSNQDSLIFGILTVVTGIIGVVLGAEASRRFKRVNPRAEPLVCACSLLAAAPCLYLALLLARTTFTVSYVFLALGELLLSCNWAVVAEILLGGGMKGHPRALCSCVLQSVVLPRCRGTAEALQITAGHILGDAGSPYLTGLVSSALRARRPDSYLQRFLSLQHSFLCCAFVIALGGGCFLLTALHLERDQTQARRPSPGVGTGLPVQALMGCVIQSRDGTSKRRESTGTRVLERRDVGERNAWEQLVAFERSSLCR